MMKIKIEYTHDDSSTDKTNIQIISELLESLDFCMYKVDTTYTENNKVIETSVWCDWDD